jgi:hypothetical protein
MPVRLYNFPMLNILGIVCAIATFGSVWLGHVAVRRIEFHAPTLLLPILSTLGLGLVAEIAAVLLTDSSASAVLGILGMTLLWDSFEFIRQERRIRKGFAPANPNNPRHARILQEYPSVTTQDWLKREPRGRAYSTEELYSIKEEKL